MKFEIEIEILRLKFWNFGKSYVCASQCTDGTYITSELPTINTKCCNEANSCNAINTAVPVQFEHFFAKLARNKNMKYRLLYPVHHRLVCVIFRKKNCIWKPDTEPKYLFLAGKKIGKFNEIFRA